MAKRTKVTDIVQEDAAITDTEIEETATKKSDLWKRQTYFIPLDMIEAIRLKAFEERRDKSEIVRAALEAYVEDQYKDRAKEIMKQ